MFYSVQWDLEIQIIRYVIYYDFFINAGDFKCSTRPALLFHAASAHVKFATPLLPLCMQDSKSLSDYDVCVHGCL